MSITKEKIAEIEYKTTRLCALLKCKPNDILSSFMKLKKEHDALENQYIRLKKYEF